MIPNHAPSRVMVQGLPRPYIKVTVRQHGSPARPPRSVGQAAVRRVTVPRSEIADGETMRYASIWAADTGFRLDQGGGGQWKARWQP